MSANNKPDYRVTVDGLDITPRLKGQTATGRPRLVSLSLLEKRGGEADQLDLVIDDTDGRAPMPRAGSRIHVLLGWAQGAEVTPGLIDKGEFTVDEVEHAGPPDAITVRARSADFTSALKTRRERSWHDTTLGAIVGEIAQRNSLQASIAPALASIPLDAKLQSRESDIAFLKRLGREHDAVATIKRGRLIFAAIGAGATPSGTALPALTLRDGDRHSFKMAKRDEASGVSASWHDRKGAKKQKVTVGDQSHAKHLARTFATEGDARRAAQAEKTRTARQPLSFTLTLALGRPDIYPERRALVSGFKAQIDEVEWLVTEVSHRVIDGYTTELAFERALSQAAPTAPN
jgi:uncharacterized protein